MSEQDCRAGVSLSDIRDISETFWELDPTEFGDNVPISEFERSCSVFQYTITFDSSHMNYIKL